MNFHLSAAITLRPCAKVNYSLDVLSLRADGRHNVATVMQAVGLFDTLTITLSDTPGVRITCTDPHVPADASNLAARAAAAVIAAADPEVGVDLHLEKAIPSQAGLGGGSSDAAYTLMGVNRLLGNRLSQKQLTELAAGLGADVTFFLHGGMAAATGIGEKVRPLPDGPELWLAIVQPQERVSTAGAYAALDAMEDRRSARSSSDVERLALGDVDRFLTRFTNDFEAVVIDQYPTVRNLMDDMWMARARNVRLCGSGSAVFGVTKSEAECRETARLLATRYPSVHVVRTLRRAECFEGLE